MIELSETDNITGYPENDKVEVIMGVDTLWLDAEGIAILYNAELITVQQHLEIMFESGVYNAATDIAVGPYYNFYVVAKLGEKIDPAVAKRFFTWAKGVLGHGGVKNMD